MADDKIIGRQFIDETENEQTEISSSPLFDPRLLRFAPYVDTVVAPKLANEFHEDPEDIAQDVWLKIIESGATLDAIQFPKSYLYKTGKNSGLNRKRHSKREDECTESLEWSDGHSKEKMGRREEDSLCCSTALNPEEKVLRKEQRSQLCSQIMSIVNVLPSDEKHVVLERLKGIPLPDIAKEIQKSVSATYRLALQLKPTQKRIVNELEIAELLRDQPELWIPLLDLIALTLQEDPTSLAA